MCVEDRITSQIPPRSPPHSPPQTARKLRRKQQQTPPSKDMTARLVVPQAAPTLLRVVGNDNAAWFPVRRVYCVGRNYWSHVKEMHAMHTEKLGITDTDPREPPFFFQKGTSTVVDCSSAGASVRYPPMTSQLEFEAELVVALRSGGSNITVADALGHAFGYGVGVDLTRRDLQSSAKQARQPWDAGKSFDDAAPVSALSEVAGSLPADAVISLRVNGEVKQESRLDLMIWSVAETIHHLSKQVELCAGDIIFTGTPAGVGPLQLGDRVECKVEGAPLSSCAFEVA